MDWNYSEVSSAKVQLFLKIRANGSRAIGVAALIRYKWGPRRGSTTEISTLSPTAILGSNDPGSLGVVLTNWVPSRYVQNSIWDGFAYAAVAFNQGAAAAQTSGLRRFVEGRRSQANWSETWEEASQLIYDDAPYIEDGES